MPKLTSIRFPDELAAAVEASRGDESFHSHTLSLVRSALTGPRRAASRPEAKTARRSPHVGVREARGLHEFTPDFKK